MISVLIVVCSVTATGRLVRVFNPRPLYRRRHHRLVCFAHESALALRWRLSGDSGYVMRHGSIVSFFVITGNLRHDTAGFLWGQRPMATVLLPRYSRHRMTMLLRYPVFLNLIWSFKRALKFICKKASLLPRGLSS
jgi:hypothetical protein